jgi:predicted Rossmann-fold nucleotide-binding protein
MTLLSKIISGGHTGADRAALDVAMDLGIPHGGWVPKGRMAEDGTVSEKYELQEMATESYEKRTEQNVLDSDGTLILSHGKLTESQRTSRTGDDD